jgi:hypothetical protein
MFNPSYTQYVLSNDTVVSDGQSPVYVNYSTHELNLIVNILGPVTGILPTITFIIQEIDPGTEITPLGMTKVGDSITTASTDIISLPVSTTGAVQILWIVSGIDASFGNVYATLIDKITTPAIYDGYGNGSVSVTLPNTPATAEDQALVVAISPNNSFTVSSPKSSTVTTSNIAASITNTILLQSNTNRLGATVYNDSSNGFLYINLNASADDSDFVVKLFPLTYYEVPFGYVGEINGSWSIIEGFARIAEFTP